MQIIEIADELRALATNGLHWSSNEYDHARYDRLLQLASQLLSMADTRDPAEIERIFRGDLGVRSPLTGVTAAVFDDDGKILLTQRKDNGKWCMPGGLADVGEPPSAVAVREMREETGLLVVPKRLIGVFDSRLSGSLIPIHLYHLDFLCEQVGGELTSTNETIAYGYFSEEETHTLEMHGSHASRLPHAFQAHRSKHWEALFQ
ncbi:MAG: NUDIX hydrolase N-terminal domain-containing protein [Chloroflexota bacterium]